METAALEASVYAEEAAAYLGQVLEHRLTQVVPIYIFASHQEFSSSNILPFLIGEGTGGYTDFIRRRVVLPFNGDYAALRHVLTHELVHAYQFDILSGENYGVYPLWLMEGMAEYLSLGWDRSAEFYIRDAVLHNRMPSLAQLQLGLVGGFMNYKGGQAVMLFMRHRGGIKSIGRFLKELRFKRNVSTALGSVFRLPGESFDIELGAFLRARYAGAIAAGENIPDRRLRRVTFRYYDRLGFNIHPTLSHDGKKIAFMSAAGIFPALVIRSTPGPGVARKKVWERRVIIKALRSKDYEEWQPLTNRISFSPDDKTLLVAGRRSGRQALLLVDIKSGTIKKSYEPPFDAMHYPSFSPDGRHVIFTGIVNGRSDLFLFRVSSGELLRLTDDFQYETGGRFSPDGQFVYYSSNKDPDNPGRLDSPGRFIYRLKLGPKSSEGPGPPAGPPVAIVKLSGHAVNPMPGLGGSLIFNSDHTGIRNLYRLENARARNSPAQVTDLIPLTRSRTGISYAGLGLVPDEDFSDREAGEEKLTELLTFTELEEGAFEVKVLPPGIGPGGEESDTPRRLVGVGEVPPNELTFNPAGFNFPMTGSSLDSPLIPRKIGESYEPALTLEGAPFILIAGGTDTDGNTSLSAFGFARLADDLGDHQLRLFLNYVHSPVTVNMDVQYRYNRLRPDFFMGIYRQSGTFPISNFLDFSFNNVLYNPNFRVLDQESAGIYGGVEYPLHRFGSLAAVIEQGRDETLFRQSFPEEREQGDIFQNFQQISLAYIFDNTVYSIFGPLDGQALSLGYSSSVKIDSGDRELSSLSFQYRFAHLFESFNSFVFKTFAGMVSGRDGADFPFRLGGFYTLRGYDFLEFEGTKAFLTNIEYRFNLIDNLNFAYPGRFSLGTIRGIFFFDAGAAFDKAAEFQAYSAAAGVTRDLHLSFGVGIHWVNFLGFILPGTIMKIEWATPYDTKRALPLSKWRGQFSLGFSFD